MAFTSQRSITETEPIVAPAGLASQNAPSQHAVTGRKRRPSPWQKPGFWVAFAALAIIVIGVVIYRRGQTTTQTSGNIERIAKVERRDFVHSVRVQGTVEAVVAHPIVAPRLAIQTANQLTLTT